MNRVGPAVPTAHEEGRPSGKRKVDEIAAGDALAIERERPTRSGPHVCTTPKPLRPGDRVVINGLVARADLNGKAGLLKEWDADRGRWAVRVGERHVERVWIKNANLAEENALGGYTFVPDRARALLGSGSFSEVCGHNYLDRNYLGHNYLGHNYLDHNFSGHNYIGLPDEGSRRHALWP